MYDSNDRLGTCIAHENLITFRWFVGMFVVSTFFCLGSLIAGLILGDFWP